MGARPGLNIPAPLPDDPVEVYDALSAANALWLRGAHDEALRWLRKAAETAAEAANDNRSLELFKAAVTLRSSIAPPLPPAKPPPRRTENPPSGLRKRDTILGTNPPLLEAEEVEEAAPESQPAPDLRATPTLPGILPPPMEAALAQEIPPAPLRPSADDVAAAVPAISAHETQGPPPLNRWVRASLPARRVAVLPGSRPGEARVVPLAFGAAAPEGCSVAMLVPLTEDDARMLAAVVTPKSEAGGMKG